MWSIALHKGDPSCAVTDKRPCEHTARSLTFRHQGERNSAWQYFALGLSTSRTVRKFISVVKPPNPELHIPTNLPNLLTKERRPQLD